MDGYYYCHNCGSHHMVGEICQMPQKNVRNQKHYTQFVIQPAVFIGMNKLDFLSGNVVKYVCRYNLKDGLSDLKKAQHYLEMLIQREEGKTIDPQKEAVHGT